MFIIVISTPFTGRGFIKTERREYLKPTADLSALYGAASERTDRWVNAVWTCTQEEADAAVASYKECVNSSIEVYAKSVSV